MPNPRPLLVLALALTLAACGGATPSRGTAQGSGATSASPESSAAAPTPIEAPETTEAPGATEAVPSAEPTETEPVETEAPGGSPSPGEAADPSASPDATNGSADECSGNDRNRVFFADAATAVDWTVLCAVLPKGWYVSAGSYRLASGGRLVIGYKGPGGATIELSEGAFCADASGCLPSGTDGGEVPLGPMTGTLVRLAAGGFAVVVDRGLNPSWQLVTHGLDEESSLAFAAAVAVVPKPG